MAGHSIRVGKCLLCRCETSIIEVVDDIWCFVCPCCIRPGYHEKVRVHLRRLMPLFLQKGEGKWH